MRLTHAAVKGNETEAGIYVWTRRTQILNFVLEWNAAYQETLLNLSRFFLVLLQQALFLHNHQLLQKHLRQGNTQRKGPSTLRASGKHSLPHFAHSLPHNWWDTYTHLPEKTIVFRNSYEHIFFLLAANQWNLIGNYNK